MRIFFRKTVLLTALIFCSYIFVSCAAFFSVSRPDLSSKEFQALILNDPKTARCYVEKTRIGMVLMDIIIMPALLVDLIGGYHTYYAYEPTACPSNFDDVQEQEPLVKSVSSRPVFVAVLESTSGGVLKLHEAQFITNVLREEAVKALSSDLNATIMTRENIREMLPPEKSLEDCEGSCLVETGKNISADYVSQARIGKFGKSLTISVELYKTANNKLVSSFNAKALDIDALEEVVRAKASSMFRDVIREEANE